MEGENILIRAMTAPPVCSVLLGIYLLSKRHKAPSVLSDSTKAARQGINTGKGILSFGKNVTKQNALLITTSGKIDAQ